MAYYRAVLAKEQKMERWRELAAKTLDRFPPSFLMVLFLFALFMALLSTSPAPALTWIEGRFGITEFVWELLLGLGILVITYFRPVPKIVLICSLPGAAIGGAEIWYGAYYSADVIAAVFILFCWIATGMGVIAMVLYQEQLAVNEKLAEEIDRLKKEQGNVADTILPTAPPALS